MWSRVFGQRAEEVPPAELLEHLAAFGVAGHFRGDDLGWTTCSLVLPKMPESPVTLERYLTDADELRADLNSWAAGLESAVEYAPKAAALMEPVITTKQLFTIRRPIDHGDEVTLDRLVTTVCQFLARRTGGFYQTDGQGFFDAGGEMLVQEY